MKGAYYERVLMQILLLGSFCQLKYSKTNINILFGFSKLFEERKCVAIQIGQSNSCAVHQENKTKVSLWGTQYVKIPTQSIGEYQYMIFLSQRTIMRELHLYLPSMIFYLPNIIISSVPCSCSMVSNLPLPLPPTKRRKYLCAHLCLRPHFSGAQGKIHICNS